MNELDIMEFIKIWIPDIKTFSVIKAMGGLELPAVVFQEDDHIRNPRAALGTANIQDCTYTFTLFTTVDDYVLFHRTKGIMWDVFSMYSGKIGSTNVLKTKITKATTSFDETQQLYTYTLQVVITKRTKYEK